MDIVGASEDIRRTYWDTSMTHEIAMTVFQHFVGDDSLSLYHFGSFCEGTTTLGLQSDVDVLMCAEDMPVIESINDATDITCYLMVTGCNTKPGYVQLQKVVGGIPQCYALSHAINDMEECDEHGRKFVINNSVNKKFLTKYAINGPAVTISSGEVCNIDRVIALRCKKVPNMANSWIHRKRQDDWPSPKQIKRLISFGCFLVGVAHPYSLENSIEWRISFSLQERELMRGLNPTQHKCYILLKMIAKDHIEPRTGKSISSYHCKTCLFHTIETSEQSIWTQTNLILCIHKCLERLLDWSKNRNCPNYFIPEENMFDRLDKQTLENVNTALTAILSSGIQCLFMLKCDNIGSHLYKSLTGRPHTNEDFHTIIQSRQNERIVQMNYKVRNNILQNLPVEPAEGLARLKELLTHLRETNQLTKYSKRNIRMALNNIIPHIHLQIAHSLASVEIRRRGTNTNDLFPLDIILNIIESSPSSRISARLSLATCYLQFGLLEACEQLLLTAESSFNPIVISVCSCNSVVFWNDTALEQIRLTISDNATTKELIDTYTKGCLVFLQSQASCVHPALHYEMYRSVYTPVSSRKEDNLFWFDWIVVDPEVYLYFMKYIFCSMTDKSGHRISIVETFCHIIIEEELIFHRETAYNLLGWMLIQENRALDAWQCFCRSWRIKPFHNAVKWHMTLLLNDLLR